MILFAVFSAALVVSPCDVVTKIDVERVLRATAVDVPANEIGEETAPSCQWSTAKRDAKVKLSIWSKDELPVVGMKDAASYFLKLRAEEKSAIDLPDTGDHAFSSLNLRATGKALGTIVVVKGERLFTFEFERVYARDAKAFVTRVMGRV